MLLAFVLFLGTANIRPAIAPPQSPRIAHIERLLTKKGFTPAEARALTSDPELKKPLKLVAEERVTWAQLLGNLQTPEYLLKAAQFLQTHEATFAEIEATFTVPRYVLTGLTGVESRFGENLGLFEAYKIHWQRTMTRKNWRWWADNFASLAAYCRALQKNCFDIRGSRDGAIGFTQVMPSNIPIFGIDADNCGAVNLDNPPDALATAANFLKKKNWQRNWKLALGRYFGSPRRYPETVLTYAQNLGLDRAQEPRARIVAVSRKPTINSAKAETQN